MVMAVFELTGAECERAIQDDHPDPVLMGASNILTVEGPGCLNCEQPYNLVKGLPCSADKYELAGDVSLRRKVIMPPGGPTVVFAPGLHPEGPRHIRRRKRK